MSFQVTKIIIHIVTQTLSLLTFCTFVSRGGHVKEDWMERIIQRLLFAISRRKFQKWLMQASISDIQFEIDALSLVKTRLIDELIAKGGTKNEK